MKNMKILTIGLVCLFIFSAKSFAKEGKINENTQIIELPDPKLQFKKHKNNDLYFALKNRRTVRTLSNESIDIKDISSLLWSASGVNRDNGNLTVPTSKNSKDTSVYMLNKDGVWIYNPNNNTIEKKLNKDIRNTFSQSFAKSAPIILVYVQDINKASNKEAGDKHAGSMYQNVALYCAIADLNNVVIGSFPKNIEASLELSKDYRVIVAQVVGKNL